jgi:hypothetical protein
MLEPCDSAVVHGAYRLDKSVAGASSRVPTAAAQSTSEDISQLYALLAEGTLHLACYSAVAEMSLSEQGPERIE